MSKVLVVMSDDMAGQREGVEGVVVVVVVMVVMVVVGWMAVKACHVQCGGVNCQSSRLRSHLLFFFSW